jgi:hypothetical protein
VEALLRANTVNGISCIAVRETVQLHNSGRRDYWGRCISAATRPSGDDDLQNVTVLIVTFDRTQYLIDFSFQQLKVARDLQSLTGVSEPGQVSIPVQWCSGFDLHCLEKTIAILHRSITDWQKILCLAVYQHEVSVIDTASTVD